MSTVTQRIPNFLLGISQQPDNRKFPGQLKDSVNAFPDYALGLLKRPGGKFVSDLYGATADGKWFSILRDTDEKYVAQYDDNQFRIWSLSDGSPRAVDMGDDVTFAGACDIDDVRTTAAAYKTAVETTATRLSELHTEQADYAEVLAGQDSTEVALFEVQYEYDKPGEIEQTVKSGILKNANDVYIVKNNNTVVSSTTTLPSGYALGTEFTDEYPLIAAEGYRVYQAIQTVAATHDATDLSNAETAMNTAQTNYDNAVTAEATALSNYQDELDLCVVSSINSDGYLNGATAADIEVLTLNDYTFVLNKAKEVAMETTTTADKPHEAFVVIKVVGTGHYRIYLDGTDRAHYNAGSGGDVDAIVSDLVADINGNTFGGKTYTAVAVGPGIYISADAAFTISVVGGPSEDSMSVFQDAVPTVADLPLQCKDGFKVRIVNSIDVDVDDMYVKFVTDGSVTYGAGVWEESNAWNITYQLDPQTLPHQIVRNANGSFTYGPITWADREIGDLETNPDPSFVGAKINNLFFYRNRLGFLSNESVILSKAGDYFNFFATTALTVTDDDPIDVSASSIKPVNLRYVKPANAGLVLFSDTQQFLIAGNEDILSPETVKITELSSYECDQNVEAVSLGTTLAFISKTPLYTRLFELANISGVQPPFMYDQTQIVPELVPQTVDSMISSPGLSIVSMGTVGNKTVYQFRFSQQGDQRAVSTWYKWDLTGTLLDQFFDASTYYAVVANGTDVAIQSFDLTQASEEGYLTLPTGEKTDVCLDFWNVNPYREYDPDDDDSDITRVYLPYEEVSGGTLAVVVLGGYIDDDIAVTSASVGAVLYPTVVDDAGGDYVDIEGDYRGLNMIIGYIYNMNVELPKFFLTQSDGRTAQSDFTSDLIVHRIKVSTGLSGPVKYQIDITGRPEWSNTIEAVYPNEYELNNVNLSAEAIHNIPIYQRNENLSIKIIGDTPMPVSLLSLNWEGRYTSGFYRRMS